MKMIKQLLRQKKLNKIPKFEHFPTIDPLQRVTPGGAFRATYTLRVVRNTNNIVLPLEIAVLGSSQLLSGYNDIINVPAGATLAVTGGTYNALPDRVRFTYTQGINIDTIDVFCSELSYPAFLGNGIVDRYRINNIRYVISNPLIQAQFNNALKFVDTGIFGLQKTNPLVPASFINPQDEKNNVVDIPIGEGFDKEKTIVHAMQPEANFEVSMMMFVEFSDKFTAESVGL